MKSLPSLLPLTLGSGVRTRRRIKKGQFIAVYSGEYITNDMAIHRSDVYDKVNRKYDFDIDFYHLRNKKMYAKATQCNSKGFEKLGEHDADNVGNTSTGTVNETGLPLQSLISPQKELQQHRDIDFDLQSYYSGLICRLQSCAHTLTSDRRVLYRKRESDCGSEIYLTKNSSQGSLTIVASQILLFK